MSYGILVFHDHLLGLDDRSACVFLNHQLELEQLLLELDDF